MNSLLQGAATTMLLWFLSSCVSITIGVVIGFVCSRYYAVPLISHVVQVLTMILRSVPLYCQLMIVYFVLPQLCGINLSAFNAGWVTLGLCSAAYTAEIIRSGINAVPIGQWQAAHVLGYSPFAQLRYIIAPQAVRICFPSLVNEYTSILKSTAILASIGIVELTKMAMNSISRSLEPVGIIVGMAGMYLLLNGALCLVGFCIERYLNVKN